ncbi:MAG: hypothetical protein ACLVBP_09925 [Ruminococcus sp.]
MIFANKYEKYLPDKDYIWMLKAETDAEYHHIVGKRLLKKLNPKDRSYIEYIVVYMAELNCFTILIQLNMCAFAMHS